MTTLASATLEATVTAYPRLSPADLPDHLQRIELDANGCWLWTGPLIKQSYGYASPAYQGTRLAHRQAYMYLIGPIEPGLTIDHYRRNQDPDSCAKRCINPLHLEVVPMRENLLRAPNTIPSQNHKVTHCPKGHEYTTDNTNLYGRQRSCRTCKRTLARTRNPQRRNAYMRLYRANHDWQTCECGDCTHFRNTKPAPKKDS